MSKTIGLSRQSVTQFLLATNSITEINKALASNNYDPYSLLDSVHGEVFYAHGLCGTIDLAKSMEVVMTDKGYRFKESPVTLYKRLITNGDDSPSLQTGIIDYVNETLRQLAAKVANEVMDGKFDVTKLAENCELFISMLVEAAEELEY